jgi:two-component system sensor histidine kinase BarA
MSHELRTPMNGVPGLTSVVLAGTLDERQRRQLEMVHDSAQALMVVINDLLDLSEIEADRLSLQTAPVSLREALRHTLAPLLALRGARGPARPAVTTGAAAPGRVGPG